MCCEGVISHITKDMKMSFVVCTFPNISIFFAVILVIFSDLEWVFTEGPISTSVHVSMMSVNVSMSPKAHSQCFIKALN